MGILNNIVRRVASEVKFKATDTVSNSITKKISDTTSNILDKKPAQNKCPKCNVDYPTDTKFCNQCGTALG